MQVVTLFHRSQPENLLVTLKLPQIKFPLHFYLMLFLHSTKFFLSSSKICLEYNILDVKEITEKKFQYNGLITEFTQVVELVQVITCNAEFEYLNFE